MDVTIVIPVYNRAKFLLRTLQTIPVTIPLIIVDNGSTDESVQIAENYKAQRMAQPEAASVTLATEGQSGAAAARNHGLSLVTTEWVYFFDSDDVFTSLPEIPQSSAIPDAPASIAPLDLICFPVCMIVNGKERVRTYRPIDDPATHILNSMLSTQSMLFRTEWLRSIGGWDNRCRIWNDWELGLRALLHRPRLLWITDQARHHIYVHDDSITGPSYSARSEAILNTMRLVYDQVQKEVCDSSLSSGVSLVAGRRVMRALDLRTHIVCGKLRREGASEAAVGLRSIVSRSTLLGRCLECYVALGGRGAWRIALKSLR